MCNIYICATNNLDKNFIDNNLYRLPKFRQEYCNRYRFDSDKAARIAAYLLLEKGLKKQYGINGAVSFVYNKNGKPYLKEYRDIFFSFSHCKNYIVCALGDIETGVDIQDISPYEAGVANRVCSEAELFELEKSKDPAELFCKFWTKKESFIKAKGIKLIDVLKKDLPDDIFCSFKNGNFYITLCHMGMLNNSGVTVQHITL